MKISEIITDKYKLRIPPTVYYDLLADVREVEEDQEPCEDAISRTEVIKSIDEREDVNGKVDAESVRTDIVLMPSVKPQEPKTGTWEEDIDNSRRWDKVRFYCSECGKWQTYGKTDYCPSCGARMT